MYKVEWDEIVILPEFKLIINVEVKSTESINNIKKSAGQLKIRCDFFKRVFEPVITAGNDK